MVLWKCYNLQQGKPGVIQIRYLSDRLAELEATGSSAEHLALHDPIGLLWHCGVLCVSYDIHPDSGTDLVAVYEHSQHRFSVGILEEDYSIDEPQRAAMALLEWTQVHIERGDGVPHGSITFNLDALLAHAMECMTGPPSPTPSSCSGMTNGPPCLGNDS
jgi:hypothetical protein